MWCVWSACPAPLIGSSSGNVPVMLSLFPSVVADLVTLPGLPLFATCCVKKGGGEVDGRREKEGNAMKHKRKFAKENKREDERGEWTERRREEERSDKEEKV